MRRARAVDNAVAKLPVEGTLRLGRPEKMLKGIRPYTLGDKARGALGERLSQLELRIDDLKVILGTLTGYGDGDRAASLRGGSSSCYARATFKDTCIQAYAVSNMVSNLKKQVS